MMGDRATLERIFAIVRRILLVPMDGGNPIPRKGTTRHECYRALYEIQELLGTRRYFGKHLPQTNADRVRSMTDEELAELFEMIPHSGNPPTYTIDGFCIDDGLRTKRQWLDWLRKESE